MNLRFLLGFLVCASIARSETPATLLGQKIATSAGDAIILAASDPNNPEVVGEAAEVSRLERLPAVAIPVQDETLAGAITTVATASGMNFIAPPSEEFPERITLTTKVSPWRLLNRLSERYRFTMAYRDGIWEFNREAVGALVAKVYVLKHTNLDVFKSSANSFSNIGSITSTSAGANSSDAGGMVFSAQTQKVIDDIRELIGLPSSRIATEDKASAVDEKRPVQGKAAETANAPGTSTAKVLYLPDSNALYVACTRTQHDLVAGYLRVIDQPPRQVHIEARFFETASDPKTVLGINPENAQPRVTLSNITSNVDLSRLSSHADRAIISVDALSVQMNALQTDTHSRLVQNPTVVTANNHECYFSVGDEEPFVSSNSLYPGVPNGGFGSSTTNVSIRRIGTSVNVVPTVFEGENGGKRRIRLVVRIEVGALKEFRQINAISIPVVASQKYEYTTFVEDNQVLAFGGLSGIGESESVKKVPIAGDVPIVGYLFKSKTHQVRQRNLVAYIIARVVDTPEPAVLPEMKFREPDKVASSHAVLRK